MSVERVVLLSEAGEPIGTAPKAEVHHANTPLHLAFSCYLFDPQGRLLITQRAWSKRTWPGVWTNSCCGHPAPEEPAAEAVSRRVSQELGAEITDLRVVLPDFRYRAVMDDGVVENEICPVYAATCPQPDVLSPDPSEVVEHAWVDWEEFCADVLAGRREVSPWCRLQLPELARAL
ncbi:isopentenyl-diphosphate Delta-isomerase [Knoellia sp. Soil729]|uniref:isopentenyl-diphosphate Delta-isomerase n=1 Tax=Knoellia sp. Soil729 TaxID=1736394 RepID=UPI0006F47FB8|nr:isopentenyl-diphosphate Delta-isomerase [Knoellia sp. Soil729]KRE42610.1 isopentenyl-diphosphate delta-isomerase [Knoellia sp. Soil729]